MTHATEGDGTGSDRSHRPACGGVPHLGFTKLAPRPRCRRHGHVRRCDHNGWVQPDFSSTVAILI
jgi:hypothetical protein